MRLAGVVSMPGKEALTGRMLPSYCSGRQEQSWNRPDEVSGGCGRFRDRTDVDRGGRSENFSLYSLLRAFELSLRYQFHLVSYLAAT
jgi:hypothetical protein